MRSFMLGYLAKRRDSIIRNFGYLLIWGDNYRLYWGVHALVVGPMDLETHA